MPPARAPAGDEADADAAGSQHWASLRPVSARRVQLCFPAVPRTSMVVNTRPGAPSRSGLSTLVPKQYLHEMQRKSARRSPTPATQKGKPCGAAPQIKPQRSICMHGGPSQNAVTQRQAQNAANSEQALLVRAARFPASQAAECNIARRKPTPLGLRPALPGSPLCAAQDRHLLGAAARPVDK